MSNIQKFKELLSSNKEGPSKEADTFVLSHGKPAITIIKMKVEGDGGNIARITMAKSAAREMIADLVEAVGDKPNSADEEVELIRAYSSVV